MDVARNEYDALRDQPLQWLEGFDDGLKQGVNMVTQALVDLETMDARNVMIALRAKMHTQEQVAHYYLKARKAATK